MALKVLLLTMLNNYKTSNNQIKKAPHFAGLFYLIKKYKLSAVATRSRGGCIPGTISAPAGVCILGTTITTATAGA
jgi:hypothetical protein